MTLKAYTRRRTHPRHRDNPIYKTRLLPVVDLVPKDDPRQPDQLLRRCGRPPVSHCRFLYPTHISDVVDVPEFVDIRWLNFNREFKAALLSVHIASIGPRWSCYPCFHTDMKLITLFLLAILAHAQEAALVQRLDSVAGGYAKNRNFIGTVLVAKGGTIILEKGYGMANLEFEIPNTPSTKFRLGSITKQFTSAAILQLQEQGKLSVNDLACKYIDGCPDAWKTVTIQHLLTHTSGIPSYTGMKDFPTPKFMRQPLTPVEVVMLTKDQPLDFAPGASYKYDNTGYVMLGVIIEKVSGEKYADYLKAHIFSKLDMQDSGYDVTREVLKNRASGYSPSPAGLKNAEYLDMSLPHAAGSLYSTVDDLYRWDRSLYTTKILSEASKKAMWTPAQHDYGYGWMLAKMQGHKQVGHGGGINGFSTYIARFPEDDAAVIILSNSDSANTGGIAGALAGVLFGEKVELPWERKEITLDSKVLDRYVGTYDATAMVFTVTNENGHLMVQPKGQRKVEAFASAEDTFFLKVVDATLTFKDGDMLFKQGGATMVGKRK